jgi:hypothetical protein
MILSPDLMRFFLVFCLVGMAVLAALYLRGRTLSLFEYLSWGLLLLVPLLGPFLVILMQPGESSLRTK